MSLDSGKVRALLTASILARFQRVASEVHAEQNRLCPVDTGYCRSRNDYEVAVVGDGVEMFFWNDCPYAVYVEHGNSNPNYHPQPFFFPPLVNLDRKLWG